MAKKYTVTENPPPFTEGLSTTTSITVDLDKPPQIKEQIFSNRLINFPTYTIIQRVPTKSSSTIVNSTVINQDITIINQGNNNRTTAEYYHSSAMSLNSRTQIINNGGLGTYDDNTSPIWSTTTNRIICTTLKDIINITVNVKCTTDTLGGSFEIEINNGTILDIIENNINIQNQDFNIEFNVVVDQNSIMNGVAIFITPELGMTLNINTSSLLIIKG